jgi:hypothetical protein
MKLAQRCSCGKRIYVSEGFKSRLAKHESCRTAQKLARLKEVFSATRA